jgi:hypothetical protein
MPAAYHPVTMRQRAPASARAGADSDELACHLRGSGRVVPATSRLANLVLSPRTTTTPRDISGLALTSRPRTVPGTRDPGSTDDLSTNHLLTSHLATRHLATRHRRSSGVQPCRRTPCRRTPCRRTACRRVTSVRADQAAPACGRQVPVLPDQVSPDQVSPDQVSPGRRLRSIALDRFRSPSQAASWRSAPSVRG